MPTIEQLATAALAALGGDQTVLRARLLAQLATTAFYLDPDRLEERTTAALALAAEVDDPAAIAAAAHARQMARLVPDGAVERLDLATQVGGAGRRLARASVAQWEPIWRLDALVELGRIPEAVAELERLRRAVERAPLPVRAGTSRAPRRCWPR